jgi:hypothetical protein
MENLNVHSRASLYETFAPAEAKRILDKWEIHYTPVDSSWFNIAAPHWIPRLVRGTTVKLIDDRA